MILSSNQVRVEGIVIFDQKMFPFHMLTNIIKKPTRVYPTHVTPAVHNEPEDNLITFTDQKIFVHDFLLNQVNLSNSILKTHSIYNNGK